MSADSHPYSFTNFLQVLNQNFGLLLIAILLIVGSFFGGSLWTENRMLRNGTGGTLAAAPAAAGTQPTASAAPTTGTVDIGRFPTLGQDSAKVVIVEFADLRCPFCKQWFDQTQPQIQKDYIDSGKVKMAFRQYEFLGPASTLAGNGLECAGEQNKFWEYHDYMYKNQPAESDTSMFTSDKLTEIAAGLGMNGNQFKSCLDSAKYGKDMDADMAEGSAVGITGTPGFIVGKVGSDGKVTGQLLVGAQPYASFKAAIDQELAN